MHIYILPQCSTTAASVLNSAGMDAQFERSCCAISRGILTEAEAAFEHKRNCIQPNKPTDRLYKSQAADGPLFRLIHHFRLLLRNQAQFRRLEGARLRHRVFRTVQAVQNQIAEERVK